MQTVYLDISNKGVIPCVQAKQSEVGRKFLAVITDNGVPYNIPTGSLLSVWYEGDTDAGNYSSIEEKSAFAIDGNKVVVELVAQMLLKPGKGELCLSITHGNGGETNTWNIPYSVEYKPGAGSAVPTEYYTALTEAGASAAKYAGEAKESAEKAQSLVDSLVDFETVVPTYNEANAQSFIRYSKNELVGRFNANVWFGDKTSSEGTHTICTFDSNVPNCAFPVLGNVSKKIAHCYVKDNVMYLVLYSESEYSEWWEGRISV